MMKKYESAKLDIVEFREDDIVTISGEPKNGSPVRASNGLIYTNGYGDQDIRDDYWLPWVN